MLEFEDRRFNDTQSVISLGLLSGLFFFYLNFSEIKLIGCYESRTVDTSGKIESRLVLKVKLLSFLLINTAITLC